MGTQGRLGAPGDKDVIQLHIYPQAEPGEAAVVTPQPLPFRAWWPPRKKTKLRRPLSRPATEARGRGREQLGRGRASQPRPLAVDGVGGSIPVPGVVVTKAPKAPAPPISFRSHPPASIPMPGNCGPTSPSGFPVSSLPLLPLSCPALGPSAFRDEPERALISSWAHRVTEHQDVCALALLPPGAAHPRPGPSAARTVPIGSGAPSLGL